MSTDVNTAVSTWSYERTKAQNELATLEAVLKNDFNKYVDSLAAYLQRLSTANNVRQTYERVFSIEDVKNNTYNSAGFGGNAAPPIENQAIKYMLDTMNPVETKSPTIVHSCDVDKLLTKKVD